ncbi:MAG: hypothetical protein HY890_07785 [Deltaproteobacteria bacterium]|nr:hypothetical protein [Deltaproteobacteria bacterium]
MKSRPARSPEKNRGKFFLTIIVVVSIAVIAAAVYYYLRHRPVSPSGSGGEKVEVIQPSGTAGGPSGTAGGPLDKPRLIVPVVEAGPQAAKEGYNAFMGGDYERAAVLFRRALQERPPEGRRDSREDDVFKNNLAQSLFALGWKEFESRSFHRAKGLFLEAFELKDDPAFLKGAAYSAIELNELAAAAKTLEGMAASDREAAGLLKGIYARLGQEEKERGLSELAAGYFEKALAIDPSDAGIKAALGDIRRQGREEAGMREKRGSHFIVKFEGGENAVTGHLMGLLLEEAYYRIGAEMGFYPGDKITALLYSDERFRDVTRTPSWAGAIYDGRIKIPAGGVAGRTKLLEDVILHEYTHAVVHRLSMGMAPVWLNEGLAQYFEGKKGDDYRDVLKTAIFRGVSLKAIEGSFMGLTPSEAGAAYALSLSATEYLIREFGIFSVKKVLQAIGEGNSIDRAMSSSIYLSYDQFEEGWVKSAKRAQSAVERQTPLRGARQEGAGHFSATL